MNNSRVITQFQFSKELVDEQKHIMGAEQLSEMLNKQITERFVGEMLSARLQDIKTEEIVGPDGKSSLQMKLELFIFNKEELTKFIEDVEKHVILNKFIEQNK